MWITAKKPKNENGVKNGAICFERRFRLEKGVKKVTLCVSALGVFSVTVNSRVVPDYFAPYWTNYRKNVNLCEYDITGEMLAAGRENVLKITVANGWYAGRLGYTLESGIYGKKLAVYAEVRLDYDNGKTQTIYTDEGWRSYSSQVVRADFFDGETIDYTAPEVSYKTKKIRVKAKLKPINFEPVGEIRTITPEKISESADGLSSIYDFKENFAGVVNFFAKGKNGAKIVVKHAEVLDKNGGLYTENLRSASAEDLFVIVGGENEFSPRFTFHGFRYAEITASEKCEITDIKGVVLSERLARTGYFECDNALANVIYENVYRGQTSNFIGLPLDCPQRDERVGWAGDAQIFFATAAYNADCERFYKNYIEILCGECLKDGRVPVFAPFFGNAKAETAAAPAWSDAVTVLPLAHYVFYGDITVLKNALPFAERWVKYFLKAEKLGFPKRLIYDYGDWLSAGEITAPEIIRYCYLAISLKNLSQILAICGENKKAERYEREYERVKEFFRNEFFVRSKLLCDTQSAYAISYAAGLLSAEEIKKPLSARVSAENGHLSTGFLGLKFLLPALCEAGESELAYEILLKTSYPSWGYEIARGATTIWERWNGIQENGEFFDPKMNSFNHYSLGSVGEWYYSHVLGISVTESGVKFCPYFTDKLGKVSGSYLYRGNKIAVEWKKNGEEYEYRVKTEKPVSVSFEFPFRTVTEKTQNGCEYLFKIK